MRQVQVLQMSLVKVLQMSVVQVLQMSPVQVFLMCLVQVLQMSLVNVLQMSIVQVLQISPVQSMFYKSSPGQLLQHAARCESNKQNFERLFCNFGLILSLKSILLSSPFRMDTYYISIEIYSLK